MGSNDASHLIPKTGSAARRLFFLNPSWVIIGPIVFRVLIDKHSLTFPNYDRFRVFNKPNIHVFVK